MKYRVAVIRDAFSRYGDPVAIYREGMFVRIDEVERREAKAGQGRCYACRIQGEVVELWQAREADLWFISEDLPGYRCG